MKKNSEIELKTCVVLRVVVATVLLGFGVLVYLDNGLKKEGFFLALVVSLVYFFNLSYMLLQSLFERYPVASRIVQLAVDLILISCVVVVTGGKSSPFVFLYALLIIFAGMTLTRTASFLTAAISGVFYFLVVLYQSIPGLEENFLYISSSHTHIWEERQMAYTYFNLIGFILVAMLSGYLSERVRTTRRELGESRERLSLLKNLHENILQSLESGVITLNLDGRIISVNRTALKILGIQSEDYVLGKDISSCFIGITNVEELISRKREEFFYITPEGKGIVLGFSCSILNDSQDNKIGYIVIFQDLTDIREMEQRLRDSEKMALLGQIAAGLAHEIRNPLSAIGGSIEILGQEVKPSDENLRLLGIVNREIERLNLLVEDFLFLAKPFGEEKSLVDLALIIDETVSSYLRIKGRSEVEITVNTERNLLVRADSYRLKQVFWNLLVNAGEAMQNGGRILIESVSDDSSVVIRVSDSGCGIDSEVIPRIFEPFFSTKSIGTGLGLTIVKKIIEGYNGKIEVTSAKGKGTIFTMTLPRAKGVIEGLKNH
jgi:two-component system sensor histidine kinase PilS (NtrC family)